MVPVSDELLTIGSKLRPPLSLQDIDAALGMYTQMHGNKDGERKLVADLTARLEAEKNGA